MNIIINNINLGATPSFDKKVVTIACLPEGAFKPILFCIELLM